MRGGWPKDHKPFATMTMAIAGAHAGCWAAASGVGPDHEVAGRGHVALL
jgi:hypothetical protein